MAYISLSCEDGIGTIRFDNDAKRNSFCGEMLGELFSGMGDLEDRRARVVILRASPGAKVWSAGLDIRELPRTGGDPLSYYDPLERVLRAIQHFPAPVIAMVEGGAWGGACDLAFVCDIIVAAPTASFAITPGKIGVPYNCSGILHFMNVLGIHTVKEMFFTAEPLSAERALDVGIVNHLVPAGELEAFTLAMARKISQLSPLALKVIKEQLRILSGCYSVSPETFERIEGLRRVAYESADYQEGIAAFLEKRKPVFRGE